MALDGSNTTPEPARKEAVARVQKEDAARKETVAQFQKEMVPLLEKLALNLSIIEGNPKGIEDHNPHFHFSAPEQQIGGFIQREAAIAGKLYGFVQELIDLADDKEKRIRDNVNVPEQEKVEKVLTAAATQLEKFSGRSDISKNNRQYAAEARCLLEDEILPNLDQMKAFLSIISTYRFCEFRRQEEREEQRATAISAQAIEEARARAKDKQR